MQVFNTSSRILEGLNRKNKILFINMSFLFIKAQSTKFSCVIVENYEREYQTTWPASWETCMQVRKQQLELDMEQQTGSK